VAHTCPDIQGRQVPVRPDGARCAPDSFTYTVLISWYCRIGVGTVPEGNEAFPEDGGEGAPTGRRDLQLLDQWPVKDIPRRARA
jgi:hypothetical protein